MNDTSSSEIALEVRDLRKSYGGVVAMDRVNLTVRRGEVHALIGQNGSGKSTLVKILTGVVVADSGTVELYGETLDLPISDPHSRGIAVIHQDIGLVDQMTVLENLGSNARYGTRLFAPVNVRHERSIYTTIMERLGFHFDLNALVSTLSPAERALLAVVRVMRLMEGQTENQLFILDEPTAPLSGAEAQRLLDLMRRVADMGSAVVFISHRLTEVMNGCDSVTVLRAGRDVAHLETSETTRSELVRHMLGRKLEDFFPHPVPPRASDEPPAIAVDGLTGRRVRSLSFAVRAGEVVGVTGLAGMGQEELPALITGAEKAHAGRVMIDGVEVVVRRPQDAIERGVVLVPGNRLRDGGWLEGTAEENLLVTVYDSFTGIFGVRDRPARHKARTLMKESQVHPNVSSLLWSSFSGGNQQKIVFAKWLQLNPRVLVLDEPTQGVDPGAAKDLLTDVMGRAAAGSAVIVCSGDHEQLAEICHRVIVLHHGVMVAELSGNDLTEQALLEASESAPAEVTAA